MQNELINLFGYLQNTLCAFTQIISEQSEEIYHHFAFCILHFAFIERISVCIKPYIASGDR